jgi:hypothetical protein
MDGPDKIFERLFERPPTDTELKQLFRLRETLGLRNNDALWQVLVALEFYQRQYERLPVEITKACEAAVASIQVTARAIAVASAAETKKDLARSVAQAAAATARGATRVQLVQWCALCVTVISVLLAGAGWCSYRLGQRSASWAAGEERTVWAGSSEGRLAYELSRVGSVRVLARCQGPGWEVRGGKCYPQPLHDQVFGWKIPPPSQP